MTHRIKLLVITAILFSSCYNNKNNNSECSKFIHEQYKNETEDSTLKSEAFKYREILLKRFNELPLNQQSHSSYHFIFYSSHGFGKSVKFEKMDSSYKLSLKSLSKKGWVSYGDNYEIEITQEEWDKFEQMIYEFNFWTESAFRTNKNVLDGFVYFLEGYRPEALKCNKRTYQFVGRGSPEYDKIGSLCSYINEYEDRLALKYGKRKLDQ